MEIQKVVDVHAKKIRVPNERIKPLKIKKSTKTKTSRNVMEQCQTVKKKQATIRRPRLYEIWRDMLSRCRNANLACYKYYGGRGISVCKEWHDYITFEKWALSHGYAENLTIDRKDNNGNYEPSNCRWITKKEQNFNKGDNVYITYDGKTQTMKQWADEIGINYMTFIYRCRHWPIEKALSERVHRNN